MVDRYSNLPTVRKCRMESAEELVISLRDHFCTYGVPVELTMDGGMAYVSDHTQRFLREWGVKHRVSSAYHPHANLRAETAVKTVKRLIADNTGNQGSLNTNEFAAALLTYRNTPDRDTGLSPAQVLFSRQLRDTIPSDPANLKLRPEWILTAQAREKALARRHHARKTDLETKSRPLKPLSVNDVVQVQNQRGNHANKWDLSGTVVQVLDFDAYLIKMDGSGRITKRNRQFLRPILPYNLTFQSQPMNAAKPLHSGPTAVSREATTPVTPSQQGNHSQPTTSAKYREQDTLPQSEPMSSKDFDEGLSQSVQRVLNNPHQNEGKRLEAGPGRALPCPRDLSPPVSPKTTRSKRVKFSTKRYIKSY